MAAETFIGVLGGIQKGGHTDDVLQNARHHMRQIVGRVLGLDGHIDVEAVPGRVVEWLGAEIRA